MKVRCYGCGRQYEPTEEETYKHTRHATALVMPRIMSYERLAGMLDECQQERDEAIRAAAGADPHILHAPLP